MPTKLRGRQIRIARPSDGAPARLPLLLRDEAQAAGRPNTAIELDSGAAYIRAR